MAIDEQERHRLHQRLEEVLGPDEAGTLMAHLPPLGWADVATKSDVFALERVLKAEIASVEANLRTEIANTRSALFRYSIVANSATLLAIFGVLAATGRLA